MSDPKSDRDLARTVNERPSSPPPSTTAEPPSLEVATRYEVGAEIARGGMGRVVEATDTRLGRIVAVKEALPGSHETMRRFQREIAITARLEHPSIVPIYDAGTLADGSPFYVMRKVSGRPLTESIDSASTLAERLALLPHVVAAAQAIAHAHRRGVIHRDIKPSNVLVGELGETIVIDWGLAKVVGEPEADDPHAPEPIDAGSSLRTRSGTVFGTPGFMAPEQVRGEAVDARSDVYALGATLYFLFARKPPHAHDSEDEMMAAAAAGPAASIGVLVAGLPRELSTIIDKALAYDDRGRYADAGALVEELQRFLTGQLVAAHAYSPRERVARFVKKNRLAVAIATIAALAFAIGGTLSVRSIVAARDRADAQAALATARAAETEEARQREQLRADQLLIEQAQALATTNPTAAIALLKLIAGPGERWTRLWRAARATAMTAYKHGVARELPGLADTWGIALSATTERGISWDRDGHTMVHDLVAYTSSSLDLPKLEHARFATETLVVAYTHTELLVIDLARHVTRRRVLTVQELECSADAAYVLVEGSVLRVDLATLATTPLALGERATAIALAPDAHALAVTGTNSLRLVDLVHGNTETIVATTAPQMAHWDARSVALATGTGGDLTTYFFDGRATQRHHFDGQILDLVALEGRVICFTPTGLDVVFERATRHIAADLRISRSGLLHLGAHHAIRQHDDVIDVVGDHGVQLRSPAGALNSLGVSVDGPRVVSSTPGHLLVWDLRDLFPTGKQIPKVNGFIFVNNDAAMIQRFLDWEWVDLDTLTTTRLPELRALYPWGHSAGLGHFFAMGQTNTDTIALIRGPVPSVEVHSDVVALAAMEDHHLATVTKDGEIALFDDLGRRTVLATHAARPTALAVAGTWVAVAYADGFVWRLNRASHVSSTIQLAAGRILLGIRRDGAVLPVVGAAILRWQPDGLLVAHAHVPRLVDTVLTLREHLMLQTTDDGRYSVSLDDPAKVTSLPSGHFGWFSKGSELALSILPTGELEELDVASGDRWPLTTPGIGDSSSAALVDDGTYAGAIVGSTLIVWAVNVPPSADDTARFLDHLTNATAELGTATLTYH